ncbi:hypothetical protein G6705_02980 [Polynucleobacter paneuropaeus]|nr:hypothetical protein [Polynucleobacter paneuropaeus]
MAKTCELKKLILLELNEVNFDLVKKYIANLPGRFPGFESLLALHSISTKSEDVYEELEPWIQWASVHTGKSYAEHKLFRLGDVVGSQVPQIFERLEMAGVAIGGISPMNAENRLKKPAYFIPDPWTKTSTDDSWWSRRLGSAVAQAVNDNAQSKITKTSALSILLGLVRFAKFKHYPLYLKLASKSIGSSWRRALVLDLFLHDLHTSFFKDKQPQFSTLFLNAGAHIQHHYFHNSPFISVGSKFKNPDWYISPKLDPFSEMLEVYDRTIEEYLADDEYELIVATGLSQLPYDRVKYYYRLKDHFDFLKKIGINFLDIHPRMTRDFLVTFDSMKDAATAQNILSGLRISGKTEPLFGEIENRGKELFVILTYPDEIVEADVLKSESVNLKMLQEVAFVAIKNGMHQSKGFAFFTPGIAMLSPVDGSHVKGLYSTVLNYFNGDEVSPSSIL